MNRLDRKWKKINKIKIKHFIFEHLTFLIQ